MGSRVLGNGGMRGIPLESVVKKSRRLEDVVRKEPNCNAEYQIEFDSQVHKM